MPEFDQGLIDSLKLAKGKKMHFCFIPKGADGKLLVSRKKIPEKEIATARKEIGGGNPVRGKCFGPIANMVFQVAKEQSPTLTAAIKKVAKRDTGLTVVPEIQVAADAEAEAPETASETGSPVQAAEAAPEAAASPPAAPPPAQPWVSATPTQASGPQAAPDAKTDVTKRLTALTAPYKEAATQKSPDAARMQSLMATVKTHVAKREFEEAAKVLDELEPLVETYKQQKEDYKVRKGEVEAAITRIGGWGKNPDKYKTAIQEADKLQKTNVGAALAALDQAKSEAEAEAKSAEAEYQTVKKSVMSKADQLRDPKIWEHVKADLEALPKPEDADAQVQAGKGTEGKKIMEGLVAPYTQAVANVQEYKKVLAKETETNKKIADLEKLKHAANVASQIAVSKQKVTNALKLTEAPGRDYAGAIAALVGVDAACVTIKKMTEMYQKVLTIKTDTDKKIARLESNPQKNLITGEIADVKAKRTAALALAEPPKNDYMGAINALNAVDKKCAAAEVKILDEAVRGKDRGDMRDIMEETFKKRFGIKLKMKQKGESPTEEYMAIRRVYELMALVPETHATNNPSLKKVERIGGPEGTSYYESETDIFLGLGRKDSKKVVLQCTRPRSDGTALQSGLRNSAGVIDPPIEEDCKPRPGASMTQSYFDWTTLHEIGHAIDDKQGFMKKNADIGGWIDHGSSCAAAAQAIANHFNFKTKEALEYIRDMLEGKPGKRPGDKPAAPAGRADWNTVRAKVERYCDSIRVNKNPWDNLPDSIGDRVYHEAYDGNWVSYLRAKRSQAISGYQFRAPGECFSELYAAYNSGVLKDSHPMVKRFLRDL
ncbi:MAG: hypothetical protein L0Y71_10800 [Gemmataceae bacterium]|nr:hypothetical protein [Gemmataceae bacterium]